jgi:1-deoxy-D-xylulose-5-phosphate synthase
VALQKLPVVFCLDRAGLVGEDGATHHGAYDLAFLRCIPDIIISAPMDESELRNLMYTAQLDPEGPFSIRYPKGRGIVTEWKKPFKKIAIGTGRMVQDGEDIAILSLGTTGINVSEAIEILAKQNIHPAHYDMRFLKPIDKLLLKKIFSRFRKIITVEDGSIVGGLGSAVIEYMNDNQYQARVTRLGIPDRFIDHGTQEQLQRICGFDSEGIVQSVRSLVTSKILTKAI